MRCIKIGWRFQDMIYLVRRQREGKFLCLTYSIRPPRFWLCKEMLEKALLPIGTFISHWVKIRDIIILHLLCNKGIQCKFKILEYFVDYKG